MKIHVLKTRAEQFLLVRSREKTFEYRINDRDFQVGDLLFLRSWLSELKTGAREALLVDVTHVLRAPSFGVPEGYAVLSLGHVSLSYRVPADWSGALGDATPEI